MRCLDLFAGTGILGLEALSQGAKHATFIEKSRTTAKGISHALSELNLDANTAVVHCNDADRFIQQTTDTFDLVFLDPPFAKPELLTNVLTHLSSCLAHNAYCYIEISSQLDLDSFVATASLEKIKHTRVGDSQACLCTPSI